MSASSILCKICQSPVDVAGSKFGVGDGAEYILLHCPSCHFSFVQNPRVDFDCIYSEGYYRGTGIDPSVDYIFELDNPAKTVRVYEWRGVLSAVQALSSKPVTSNVSWLDYGCGNGGLVRYVRATTGCDIIGYDEGWIVDKAMERGIPVTRRKDRRSGVTYDIITAIEVLEHLDDPITVLREIRSMLAPGGVFFFTTGNAEVHRARLLDWNYFSPEIHVSLFEPATLKFALESAGFKAFFPMPSLPGWPDIIRFKLLKFVGVRRVNWLEKCIPWKWITPLVDRILKVSYHPVGLVDGHSRE